LQARANDCRQARATRTICPSFAAITKGRIEFGDSAPAAHPQKTGAAGATAPATGFGFWPFPPISRSDIDSYFDPVIIG